MFRNKEKKKSKAIGFNRISQFNNFAITIVRKKFTVLRSAPDIENFFQFQQRNKVLLEIGTQAISSY